MKLYTEEQMRKIYDLAFINLDQDGSYIIDGDKYFQDKINELTPIELPSDKEIEKQSYKWVFASRVWEQGAKWMKEQILNQNKQNFCYSCGGDKGEYALFCQFCRLEH